jgi:hypothetical protein
MNVFPFTVCCLLIIFSGGSYAFTSLSTTSAITRVTRNKHGGFNALPESRRQVLASGLSVAVVSTVRACSANEGRGGLTSYFGVYTDPNHPKGYRIIFGDADGSSVTLMLQDEPTSEVYFSPIRAEKDAFIFDFSTKDGPTNVVSTLGKDKEGIPILTFPDGNKWKKRETGIVGVYKDESNPKNMYSIRQVKGTDLAVDQMNGSKVVASFSAKSGSSILFDFPGKTSLVPGVASMRQKTITFEDGTIWTKF